MVGFIMTRRTLNLYLRMTGLRLLMSRTAPTQSTSSNRSLRRRRSSTSAAHDWINTKPVTKQRVGPEGMEEMKTIKEFAGIPGSIEEKPNIKN